MSEKFNPSQFREHFSKENPDFAKDKLDSTILDIARLSAKREGIEAKNFPHVRNVLKALSESYNRYPEKTREYVEDAATSFGLEKVVGEQAKSFLFKRANQISQEENVVWDEDLSKISDKVESGEITTPEELLFEVQESAFAYAERVIDRVATDEEIRNAFVDDPVGYKAMITHFSEITRKQARELSISEITNLMKISGML